MNYSREHKHHLTTNKERKMALDWPHTT